MERAELVEEIVRRVAARLNAMDDAEKTTQQDQKPGLLLLAQSHGAECPCTLNRQEIRRKWRVDCALQREYQVELSDYSTVVIRDLDCRALDQIASGTWSCDYTRLATQAILQGKEIYILFDEMDLYRYQESAPTAYFKMMQQKLDFLQEAGVVFCTRDDLEQLLTGTASISPKQRIEVESDSASGREMVLSKRVLTQRDLTDAEEQGITRIRVGKKCIITALAKEAAAFRGISIVTE